MKITGVEVKAKRTQLKLSRAEFAQRCGLTAAKLWRIETKNEFKILEREKIVSEFFKELMITASAGWMAPQSMVITDPVPIVELPEVQVVKGGISFQGFTQDFVMGLSEMGKAVLTKLSPTFNYDTTRYISHSEIATFQDCPRKWWLAYHRGLRPLEEKPLGALAMGTRVHKALEAYYTPGGVNSQDPRDVLAKLTLEDWSKLSQIYTAKFEVVPPEVKKKFDTEAKMQAIMVEGYLEWTKATGSDSNYDTIEPEEYVEVTDGQWHDDRELKFVGRIDRRVRRVHDGAIFFEDFKTTASIPALVKVLPINTQMKHYLMLLAMQAAQNGTTDSANGALYTMLRKSMQSQTATPPFYERVEVYHNPLEQANYRTVVGSVVSRIETAELQLAAGPKHHHGIVPPRPSNDCSWKCPFFQACPMFDDGSHVESMLENHFTTGNALDYYNPAKKETE